MGNCLSTTPTWWELLQSILKQGYVYIIWKGDIIKQPIENKGSDEYPNLHLCYELTYPVILSERDYNVTWSKNKEDLIPVPVIDKNTGWEKVKELHEELQNHIKERRNK